MCYDEEKKGKKVIKKCLLCIFLLNGLIFGQKAFASSSLHQKFNQAKQGDYIVTAQQGHYTLLFIRTMTDELLGLEEVSIPERLIDTKKIHWQEWVDQKAPGHTSWMLYTFDRKKGVLLNC